MMTESVAPFRARRLSMDFMKPSENREPSNSARDNLKSLELCFAAVASSERHRPVVPGTVKKMPG